MNITHIIFSLGVGGSENIMIDIINNQVKLGHTVSLVVVNNGIKNNKKIGMSRELLDKIDNKVLIYKLNRPAGSRNIFYFFKLYFWLFRFKSDILHSHSANLGKILKYYNRKKVMTIHAVGLSPKSLKYFDAIAAISKSVQKYLLINGKFDSTVIYNGIQTNLIKLKKRTQSGEIKIVQISRLVHEIKGQDILINALSILVKQYKMTNVKCYFIGEGASYDYLQNLVKSLSLEKYVVFLGLKTREYVYKNLYTFDLLIQPSRYEGFGLTIIEAMSAKVSVVVSNIDGPMEVIQEGKLGEAFESENVEGLAEKIFYCINNKNEQKLEYIYNYAKENYDIKVTTNNYMSFYKKILGEV